jgi:Asp-tRNA(Asn)/Glu-tRNA(Gln) amidotransferase A subunit family amidase
MSSESPAATEIAANVRARRATARAVTEAALARIAALDGKVNSFTDVLAERALATPASTPARRCRSCRSRSAPTPTARSACRRRSAGCLG